MHTDTMHAIEKRSYWLAFPFLFSALAVGCHDGGTTGPEPPRDAAGEPVPPPPAASFTPAATFTVVNTSDAGAGSLRQAILDANASAGADLIDFAIPGAGPHTIQPLTPLPTVTDPVVLDGYTQPGASPNTNGTGLGSNAVLKIELDGSAVSGGGDGLKISAGESTVRGLVINRFFGTGASGAGIHLLTNGGNVIEGNFIGTDPSGHMGAGNLGAGGVFLTTDGNTIGGTTPAARNVISDNVIGVNMQPGDGNIVQGNFIGTDVTGTVALGNTGRAGIFIFNGSNNQIGGTVPGARNLISGNAVPASTTTGHGIEIGGSPASTVGNVVEGNFIGTDVTGTAKLPNRDGVLSFGADTRVGGTAAGAGNLVSGNDHDGVSANGAGSLVQGNLIGTDVTGDTLLGNGRIGVGIQVGSTVGGTTPEARNIVSGNADSGISICSAGTAGNLVQGNHVGTDVTGTVALGGQGIGVFVCAPNNTTGNLIGGTAAGAGNVISGNSVGVDLRSPGATVQGNLIGTDVTGTDSLGNADAGVNLQDGGAGNLIGGTMPEARNVISASITGVRLSGPAVTGNRIEGNYIGTDITGAAAVSNQRGILLASAASNNTIGDSVAGAGNLIAFNTTVGIFSPDPDPVGNAILGNSIHSNGGGSLPFGAGLGIDWGADGVTSNDPGDTDAGANGLQNFPVLTSSVIAGGTLTVQGTLGSAPLTTFRLEFFASSAADPTDFGEGETFVGSGSVTTDAAGDAPFTFSFASGVPAGWFVSATATDPGGNTSEFSGVTPLVADSTGPIVSGVTATPNPVAVGTPVALTANVDDTSAGGSDVTSAEYSLDGGSSWAPMSASDGAFDEVVEDVEATFGAPSTAGVFDLCVRGEDTAGNVTAPECIMLVAYDPSAGFVTGGGWIDSPPGAYAADPMAAGQASFGFVSKYLKGKSVPTGDTQFRFHAGDLNFHSSSYDWLVVNQGGTNAQFKGSGTVNGGLAPNGSEFLFMIWARDDTPDTFRIRIWWEQDGVETDVYDNGFDQPIGGGQITIHEG